MSSNSDAIIQWFSQIGNRYVESYLSAHDVNVGLLRCNPEYGLKLFLFRWAYERSGASYAYRIAAVKSVSAAWPDLSKIPQEYSKFYRGHKNASHNPCLDSKIEQVNIPRIVEWIEQGNLEKAFHCLQVRGIAHKIAAFFIRDIITVIQSENKVKDIKNYLYCQPIDTWVRDTVDILALPTPTLTETFHATHYRIYNAKDLNKAIRIIYASLRAGVSPLRVNQGIWYFSSNAVGDSGRLRELLTNADTKKLADELSLIDKFMP
ncbi:hypothetical protein KSD_97340 [Ktedonobacter sp. SOSP1-85]|uniref:hypothetical protein n=1 Tax=Ktedonobacter sp. SOSP1-85 TaxID=2778367 RepID=UPI001915F874|nr:hypothetical protein [Ktedonobacter sp. SOSP1-85]GHO81963.1 hypothetical protein KSD_97340 [Ktedonobacter sp. SOSP1-85]